MQTTNLIQGSQAWNDYRKYRYPASEAPSMMNEGKYDPKKSADLALIRLGLKTIESNPFQESLFKEGHKTEACAKPLVEELIGEPLAALTGELEVDGLGLSLSASFDGLTFFQEIIFEHKLWNESLAEAIRNRNLPPSFYWQLEQQLLVSGAEKVIFVTSDSFKINAEDLPQFKDNFVMCSKAHIDVDGNEFYYAANNFEYMEYTAQEGLKELLIEGWIKFEHTVAEVLAEDEGWLDVASGFLKTNQELKKLTRKKKILESRLEPYKKSLVDSAKTSGTTRIIGGGVQVSKRTRKGSLDESLLLNFISEEDLEKCRKDETYSWSVSELKKKTTVSQIEEARKTKELLGKKDPKRIPVITPDKYIIMSKAFNF